jgi:pyruvate formate lyase activating enzyme
MRSAWDRLRGFEHFSLCDWTGHTSCVLFLGGCNFLCPTCHNADIAWRPEWMPIFPRRLVEEYIAKRAQWLDGIVVTGGEPTVCDGLAAMLRDLGKFGLPVKLDTNGMLPDVVEVLLEDRLAREFYVDVKGPWAKYPALAGGQVTEEAARRNMERIFALAAANPGTFTFRTTVVPLLDDDDISEVRALLPAGHELHLQTGRLPGDLVHGPDRQRDSQGAQGQWHQGPAAVQAAGA